MYRRRTWIHRSSSALSVATMMLMLLSLLSRGSVGVRITCTDGEISNCVKSFEPYLEKGVIVLANKSDDLVSSICWKYEEASDCLASYIYYCHKMLRYIKKQLTAFEYACNAVERKGQWPFVSREGDRELNEAEELFNFDDGSSFVDAIIKTCLAAGVTFIVIMMCVIADCTSKWRIRQRVRRAMAAREQGILKAVVVTGDAIQL